jgi:Flp pilus assembly pilin Flp
MAEGRRRPRRRALSDAAGAFGSDERGSTAIEYGIFACGAALAVVVLVGGGVTPGSVFRGASLLAEALTGEDQTAVAGPASGEEDSTIPIESRSR